MEQDMSDIFKDMAGMHMKYMVPVVVNRMDKDMLGKFLAFRLECCQEELDETKNALDNHCLLYTSDAADDC